MVLRELWMATEELKPFALFDLPHITALAIFALIWLCIVIWKDKIRNPKSDRLCRIFMFIVLACQQLLFYIWKLDARASLATALPLHICGFSIFLCLIVLVTQNVKLFYIIYYFAFSGTLQAVLTPNMEGYNYPHFRFFQYFAGHLTIIIVALYFKVVKEYKIKLDSLLYAFVTLNVLAAAAFAANIMLDTNYMFLLHKPDSFSFLSILAPWPYYLIQLEFLAVIFFLIIYSITNIKDLTFSLSSFLKKVFA